MSTGLKQRNFNLDCFEYFSNKREMLFRAQMGRSDWGRLLQLRTKRHKFHFVYKYFCGLFLYVKCKIATI